MMLTTPVADYWERRAGAWTAEKRRQLRTVARLNRELRQMLRARKMAPDMALRAYYEARVRSVHRELDAAHEEVRSARYIAHKISQMVEEVRAL